MVDWLRDNAVDLIGLTATLGLLGVTAWYARTTKEMAEVARHAAAESARATAAAEHSAEASLDAARVAQSQIKPDFSADTVSLGRDDDTPSIPCLRIESKGDAVVVQSVRIRRAIRTLYTSSPNNPRAIVRDLEMTVAGIDNVLPQRLHFGETMLLTHPVLEEQEGEDKFWRFFLDVEYTFTERGGAGAVRQIRFDAS